MRSGELRGDNVNDSEVTELKCKFLSKFWCLNILVSEQLKKKMETQQLHWNKSSYLTIYVTGEPIKNISAVQRE